MAEQQKPPTAASQSTAPKPPKKLIPRPAPKAEAAPEGEATPIAAPVTTPAPAGSAKKAAPKATAKPAAKPVKATVKKPSELDEINAKNKKAMVDALAMAQAVKIAQPLGRPLPAPDLPRAKKAAKAEKPAKAVKVKKARLVRDSYAMPEAEYAQIGTLKKRLATLGSEIKKSELLRAGIATLAALNDHELQAIVGRVERIKTGRPAKNK